MLPYFLFSIYAFALLYITAYCLLQLNLLRHYRRHRRAAATVMPLRWSVDRPDLPLVTVQLPIYNEYYVIERLLAHVVAFAYPRDRLDIQVLDDSDDETVALVRDLVARYRAQGVQIEQVRRPVRQGYKAGALRDAMPLVRGEYVAIFDADFLPRPDFLLATLPHFRDERVGVVQSRWEHINRDYSLMTRLQAFHLDMHFSVEQKGREVSDNLLQFNGTAGVWRKATIVDAGGWEADTLTEDLDLSYRAQLRGWKIHFLEELGSPAELPAEMNSFKSQQFRWSKGGAETARKMLPIVWRSHLTWRQKLHATLHLTGSSVFIFVFLAAVLSVPLSYVWPVAAAMYLFPVTVWGMVAIVLLYYETHVRSAMERHGYLRRLFKFLVLFPTFLTLTMGLSLHNTIAVLQGYWGRKTAFVRTPKFNIQRLGDSFRAHKYLSHKLPGSTIAEAILALYFLAATTLGVMYASPLLVYHGMLALGFGYVSFYSLRHYFQR